MHRYTDQRVLVTGAAGGIGAAIARAYLQEGARVQALDMRAESIARFREALPPDMRARTLVGTCDVRRRAAVEEAIDAAWQALGGLDIAINAAGIYPSNPLLTMTDEAWDRVLDTNLKGPLLVSQIFARRLVQEGRAGNIVNITSGASERARRGAAHYCTSKAALAMLTRAFALELAPHGIRVNAVSPGFVEVPGEVSPLSEAYVAAISRGIPLGRSGQGEDIAKAVLFMTSSEAPWVTGSTLRVDGGSSAGNILLPLSDEGMTA